MNFVKNDILFSCLSWNARIFRYLLKNDLYLSLWDVILEMKGSDWLILNDQSEMSMFLVFAGGVYKKPISLKISVVVC